MEEKPTKTKTMNENKCYHRITIGIQDGKVVDIDWIEITKNYPEMKRDEIKESIIKYLEQTKNILIKN
jgi:hypothetical protein